MNAPSDRKSIDLNAIADLGAPSAGYKRAFDLAFGIALLPIVVPIVALLYVLARSEGGAGFFGHRRIGKGGHSFWCWKIQTMVPNADHVLEQHFLANPEARVEWERDRKLSHDPRVTRIGRFLRQTSLDELPQIWNVLRGEMSFVGPRPVTKEELDLYRGYEWCYLSTKPGITGLWQVSGRNDVTYSERVQLDVDYYTSRSMRLDMSILLRTIGVVVRRTGR